ncbi:MAG TPA: FAD-binding oxidoreductase [Jatrophihabitans sp.]|nr:FAD-binding oxidoreductase [Jatrophihabitans sp.]
MQVCVIGGGLAGTLLAWRLAGQPGVGSVLLAPGVPGAADATAASGGNVRAFEVDPAQRQLALQSMAELASDARLRDWSGFTGCGSLYLPAKAAGLAAAVAGINAVLAGSASLVEAGQLAAAGWAGLAGDELAVRERCAGYLDPHRFRRSVLADLAGRARVELLPAGPVGELTAGGCTLAGRRYVFDLGVIATGAWTPAVLRASGLDTAGLATKSIQYAIHRATGAPPTGFVDDRTELFGRPLPGDRLLLGLPTGGWAADPAGVPVDEALSARAAELAITRFPALRLHAAERPVTAVDCYAESGLLQLRPVPETDGRLLTFTGGSGGAAKTALAASRRAATQLAGRGSSPAAPPHHPVTLHEPELQPTLTERSSITS